MDSNSTRKKCLEIDISQWNKIEKGILNWEIVMNSLCDECRETFISLTKRQRRKPKHYLEKIYGDSSKFVVTFD